MSFQTCMNVYLLWNIIWEIQDIFVHTVKIKSNQNGLVTFYKILFCVKQKKVIWNDMRVRELWQNLLELSSSLAHNQCFSLLSIAFLCGKKCIIKFFVFVVNSVIAISIRFCPVLFIHLFTTI